jgi:hypothetical protein
MKIFILALLSIALSVPLVAQTEDPHKAGNVPISFYGKVVDQSNQPVADVKVEMGILSGYLKSPQEFKQKVTNAALLTDADGRFALENASGSSIQLNAITKDGYKLSPKQAKAAYLYYPPEFHPDVNNPVVFQMWKMQGAESLLNSSWHGKVHCDGTLLAFDLRSGKPTNDGDLQIVCIRTPLSSPPPGNAHFDYKFQITLISGGIQPTGDEFTYLAPETGYSPSFTVEQKADDPKWWGRVTKEFYIKTSDGHYGRLFVDWYAAQNSPNHIEWDCSINPSGSRNLER